MTLADRLGGLMSVVDRTKLESRTGNSEDCMMWFLGLILDAEMESVRRAMETLPQPPRAADDFWPEAFGPE